MSLKIISASAGSGKTYRLTLEYLKLCFRHPKNDYFKHILAITFTNKATEEMKGRILVALRKLALKDKEADYQRELMQHCQLDEDGLAKKASGILQSILEDYHYYQILTIDSFFYGLYQSFLTELKIQAGGELHFGFDRLMKDAVRNYTETIDVTKKKDWSIVQSLMEQEEKRGKRFQLHQILENIGRLLDDETFDGKTIFDQSEIISEVEQRLRGTVSEMDNALQSIREQLSLLFSQSGLTAQQFSGGNRSWASTLQNTALDWRDLLDKKTLFAVANGEKMPIAKSAEQEVHDRYDNHRNQFELIFDVLRTLQSRQKEYLNARAILENWSSFFLVNAIEKEMSLYLEDRSLTTLTLVTQRLHREMKKSDAALIYEKLGVRIEHVMVDEFQDTSVLQWMNLEPLILECLSNGHECLLVGDVKQSIYRFRNGNWKLLQEIVPKQYGSFIDVERLDTNWRSASEIVLFNNDFFQFFVPALQHQIEAIKSEEFAERTLYYEHWLRDIYENTQQKIAPSKKHKNGLVQLEYLPYDVENKEGKTLDRMIEHLKQIKANHYALSDIAILVQRHKEAERISDYLMSREKEHDEHWPHVLDAAMELCKIPVVVLLVSFLRLKQKPSSNSALVELYRMLEILDLYAFDPPFDAYHLEVVLRDLGVWEVFQYESNSSLFFLKIVNLLRLNEKKEYFAGIDFLLTKMQEYGSRNGMGAAVLLKYWEEELYAEKIIVGKQENQISIVTMHQSKGLEYEVVLIPFANGALFPNHPGKKQYLMCDIGEAVAEDLNYEVPLTLGKALGSTDFALHYFEEKAMQIIDLANLYYVAFTRAVDRLYVLTSMKNKRSNQSNMSGYIEAYLEGKELFQEGEWKGYRSGDHDRMSTEHESHEEGAAETLLHYPIREKWPVVVVGKRVEKIYQEGETNESTLALEKGLLTHHILEQVSDWSSISSAVHHVVADGLLPEHLAEAWIESLQTLLQQEHLRKFYFDGDRIINERSIFIPGVGVRVPDRVVVRKEETLILDYKTGKPQNSHQHQVREYALTLKTMGYQNPRAYLFYLTDNELLEVALKH